MDEQRFREATARVMSDESPLDVQIKIMQAWLLVSAIQLAVRHPDLSIYMKRALIEVGRQFQTAIAAQHPEATELLEMGWNSEFDI